MSLANNKKIKDKEKQQRKLKVLFFEDVQLLIMDMENCFKEDGFITKVTDKYKEAFRILKKPPPTDLIIIDLYMPDKKLKAGIIFIEKLKNKQTTKDIPLLVYTNFLDYIIGIDKWPEEHLKMTELGRKFYTAKKTESLLDRILKAGVSKDKLIDKTDIKVEKLLKIAKALLKK